MLQLQIFGINLLGLKTISVLSAYLSFLTLQKVRKLGSIDTPSTSVSTDTNAYQENRISKRTF